MMFYLGWVIATALGIVLISFVYAYLTAGVNRIVIEQIWKINIQSESLRKLNFFVGVFICVVLLVNNFVVQRSGYHLNKNGYVALLVTILIIDAIIKQRFLPQEFADKSSYWRLFCLELIAISSLAAIANAAIRIYELISRRGNKYLHFFIDPNL